MKTVGVLPMAGSGTRLGLPFHKSLAPTFDSGGSIVPVYEHSRRRLATICDEIVAVISPDREHDPCLEALPMTKLVKHEQGEAPSSIAFAAKAYPDTLLAVSLPDTIWEPFNGFVTAKMILDERVDGVLMLWNGPNNVLDEVLCEEHTVRGVFKKNALNDAIVMGWGAFLVRSNLAAQWTDDKSFAEHLSDLDLRPLYLGEQYVDIGTKERYTSHLRGWL